MSPWVPAASLPALAITQGRGASTCSYWRGKNEGWASRPPTSCAPTCNFLHVDSSVARTHNQTAFRSLEKSMTMRRFQDPTLPALVLTLIVAALGISGAHAQIYTDIHDFDTPLLASPQYSGILAQGRDGNLYGTAPLGGASGRGGVFSITSTGAYSVIQSFDSTLANPYSGLTLGKKAIFMEPRLTAARRCLARFSKSLPPGS